MTTKALPEKDNGNKAVPFLDRAAGFNADVKLLTEKWGIIPWAGLSPTQESIMAVPLVKDIWASEEPEAEPTPSVIKEG